MTNVINLHSNTEVKELADEIKELVENERLSEFICIYRFKPDDDEVAQNAPRNIAHFWFGSGSSIMCLGLAHHMVSLIEDYIRENSPTGGW